MWERGEVDRASGWPNDLPKQAISLTMGYLPIVVHNYLDVGYVGFVPRKMQ